MASDRYHRRTVITRLAVSEADTERLEQTVTSWLEACNIASEMAWDSCDSPAGVQQLAYDRIRDETDLGSQHTILATHHVSRAIKSGLERRQNGKRATKPTFTSPSMTFDTRTMTLFEADEAITLTTHGDHPRVRAELALPADEDGYQYQFLHDDEWQLTESTLHYRDGDWYAHLGFRRPACDPEIENGTVLGVDLGVTEIAVTSTARFFSAGELNHLRREFEHVRCSLQSRDTRSAYRTLDQLTGRETERVKHALHEVANGIVNEALENEALENDCDGIVFEELSGIRERLPTANWHSEWAFDRLYEFVAYKAESQGLFVDTTSPKNTSRQCPECGYTDADNRVSRDLFDCRSCDCTGHADYIASKNVAAAYLRRDQQLSRRRGVSQYALKSGTVTPVEGETPLS